MRLLLLVDKLYGHEAITIPSDGGLRSATCVFVQMAPCQHLEYPLLPRVREAICTA